MHRTTISSRAQRALFAAVVAATMLVTFGALGGVGFARTAISAAQYQYGGQTKVTLCHKAGPHGKTVTITVGEPAVAAHLAHGDKVGTCAAVAAKAKAKAEAKAKAKAKADAAKQKAKGKAKAGAKSKGGSKAQSPQTPSSGTTPGSDKGNNGKGNGSDKGNNGNGNNGNGKGNGRP